MQVINTNIYVTIIVNKDKILIKKCLYIPKY